MDSSYIYKTIPHTPSQLAKSLLLFVYDLGWYQCQSDYRVKRIYQPYSIRLVLRGRGYAVWRGKTHSVGPGQLLFLDLTEEHEYFVDPEDPWEIIWVRFGGTQAAEYHRVLGCTRSPVLNTRDSVLVRRLFEELVTLFEQRPPGYEFTASSLLTQIFTDAAIALAEHDHSTNKGSPLRYPEHIYQVIQYIEENYLLPLTIEELASHVFISPGYLSRSFKLATGCTVTEYIIKHRLLVAKKLLADSEHSLGEVAQAAGFCSQSYFSKLFKRDEGVSPLLYRRSVKQ